LRNVCLNKLRSQHFKQLEMNNTETIYNLEMFFPPSIFNSMEHLSIHLSYETNVGGHVQYIWMYSFKRLGITCFLNVYYVFLNIWSFNLYLLLCRYLYNFKKKDKTKMHVETLICETLVKRFQYLSYIILNLTWEQESIVFQDMMVVVRCLRVRIYQYFSILEDHCWRIQFQENIWRASNSDKHIIICKLTTMDWDILFSK